MNAALEALWEVFGDEVAVNDDGITDSRFLHFPAGIDREIIWRWFDEYHSKGVYYLMFGEEAVRVQKGN